MGRLLTVGHGTLDRHALGALLSEAGASLLVDVRRFPHSRHNEDVDGEAMATWLPEAGIGYRWDERLGGRRRLAADDDEDADGWWRVEAFRAYAAHTRTPAFLEALADLAADVGAHGTTAVMCSEAVWWRCHRRLVADAALLLAGLEVAHLAHSGKVTEHEPSGGARVAGGVLRYDAGTEE
jgi:uncharacterized protein (DUF488 family)